MTMRTRFEAAAAWAAPSVVPADGGEASGFGDTELKSFAAAALRINRINSAYTPKIHGAGSSPEKRQLERRASGEILAAVAQEGLNLDRYQSIATRLQTDALLAQRVKEKLKDLVT